MKDYFSYAWVLKRLGKIILSDRRHPISMKYHKSHDKKLYATVDFHTWIRYMGYQKGKHGV